jgi:hypothetical protein
LFGFVFPVPPDSEDDKKYRFCCDEVEDPVLVEFEIAKCIESLEEIKLFSIYRCTEDFGDFGLCEKLRELSHQGSRLDRGALALCLDSAIALVDID